MPPVITCINAFKQNLTGGAFESLAAASGDSLSIVNFNPGASAYAEEIYASNSAHKMEVAVFSPRFGDPVFGLRLQHNFVPTLAAGAKSVSSLLPREFDVPVYATDTLTVQVNGTAADNANVALQLYYNDVPGTAQRLANWEQVQAIGIIRSIAVEVTVTPGATGNYGTAVAINANDDRFRADTDYALLGMTGDQAVMLVTIKGPDTGNFRVPCSLSYDERNNAGYFIDQDVFRPTPHIPILNSNNKATTFLEGIDAANPGATKVSLLLGELASHFQRP